VKFKKLEFSAPLTYAANLFEMVMLLHLLDENNYFPLNIGDIGMI